MQISAIKRVVDSRNLHMEIIVNNKTFTNGLNVIQLETAVGAAMKSFEGCLGMKRNYKWHLVFIIYTWNAISGIRVNRDRFLPVKKTSDLLLVMSNLYDMRNGSLTMTPQRMFPTTPLIKLGDNHFAKVCPNFFPTSMSIGCNWRLHSDPRWLQVKEFLERFPTIPDLLELDHLTVSGDVTFGKGVCLKGTVIIIANHGERIDLPSGTILENKIVSGNLRILSHWFFFRANDFPCLKLCWA